MKTNIKKRTLFLNFVPESMITINGNVATIEFECEDAINKHIKFDVDTSCILPCRTKNKNFEGFHNIALKNETTNVNVGEKDEINLDNEIILRRYHEIRRK